MTTSTLLRPASVEPDVEALSPAPTRFRPDIDGLRAVAVLLVVLYHAGVPGFRAGFVGVDVFFVISGFLITQLLVDEFVAHGRIRLARFWARRARRLLPAVSLVVTVVLAVSLVTSTALEWKSAATAALATTLYWANRLFAHQSVDYFHAGVRSSPLLHTWSLAVEEQFYLVWPLLLAGVGWLSLRSGSRPRRVFACAVGLVTVCSFGLSASMSTASSPAAFFSAGARAWELGVGGLLALAAPTLNKRSTAVTRWVLGLIGIGLLGLTLVLVDPGTVFPGRAALGPVLGTAAIIAAGLGGSSSLGRLLALRPARYVGRLSYSWYLWHWPVLVLGTDLIHRNTLATRIALAAASVLPAVATHHLIEDPVRHNYRLSTSTRRSLAVGLALVVSVGLLCGVTSLRADHDLRDPLMASLVAARRARPPLPDTCATTGLDLLRAHCSLGDLSATTTVLVVGDSHAAQWVPALTSAGRLEHFRLVTSIQGSCPAIGDGFAGERPSCARRLLDLPNLVARLRPDLVVMADSANYIGALIDRSGHLIPRNAQLAAWTLDHERWAVQLRDLGIGLVDLLDIPQYRQDPIDCIARTRDARACSMTRTSAVQSVAAIHNAEKLGLRMAGHGVAVDPLPLLCNAETCPLVTHGAVVYTDGGHLTATYSASQADALARTDALTHS